MRFIIKRLGPSETSKIVSDLRCAPNVSEVFMEERDYYLVENWSFEKIKPNQKGDRLIAVAKADDRLLKREPLEEDEFLLKEGKQKKIVFVDLTQED
ncbi:MAG TPA: hypothetical protein DHV20_08750 [Brochothrix thermosphacta]|nr:hypothetical protein [Brochothrix thermosphacta]HCZ46822.1 hypothetical protein [Brochothrix thermosphacta]